MGIRLQDEMKKEQQEAEHEEERRTKNRVTRMAPPSVACATDVKKEPGSSSTSQLPTWWKELLDVKPPTQPFVARKARHSLKRVELAACIQLEHQKPMIGERLTTLLLETLGVVETGMIVSMMLHIDNDKLMDLIDNPIQLLACADVVRKVLEQSRVEQVRQSDATAAAARQRLFVDEGVQTETRSASSAGAEFGSPGAGGIGHPGARMWKKAGVESTGAQWAEATSEQNRAAIKRKSTRPYADYDYSKLHQMKLHVEQINERLKILREAAANKASTERVVPRPVPPPDRSLREPDSYLYVGGNAGRCRDYEEVLQKANEELKDRGIEDATGSLLCGAPGADTQQSGTKLVRELVTLQYRPGSQFMIVTVYHGAEMADKICANIKDNFYLAGLKTREWENAFNRKFFDISKAVTARLRHGYERARVDSKMDSAGWVTTSDALSELRRMSNPNCRRPLCSTCLPSR